MENLKNSFLLIILFIFGSCNLEIDQIEEIPDPIDPSEITIDNLKSTSTFNWKNTQDTEVIIYTKDNEGNPISNVRVSVWSDFEEENGTEIINGVTDNQGKFSVSYNFEADMEEIVLKTNYIGFIPQAKIPIENGNVEFTFGGDESSEESEISNKYFHNKKIDNRFQNKINANVNINYLGSYDKNGVPKYLENKRDKIKGDFLDDINTALPEYRPVPEYHPEYLMRGNEHNLVILDEAEVWITFVSEGAGFTNVLAYYTYDIGSPPQTPEDIEDCYVIFPNTSFRNSGGGLKSGDKVSLGTFPKNTVIGWILMRNGWDAGNEISTEGLGLLYSNLELNPETNDEHKQHCVLLLDEDRDLFLISFEDLIRPGGDADFNDAVFYATANPIENVEVQNVLIANAEPVDTDNDGISDSFDDYPEDPNLAFNNYYVSNGEFGSLAFEDQWPSTGDYDFNDLVIDYNFNRISNSENKVVTLQGKFVVRAIGASYDNGFGFTIEGIDPSLIESVTGIEYTEGYIQNNSNGTESGQSDATIIVFDNAWNHGYSNTRADQAFVQADTLTININLVSPIDPDNFGVAPFNPFMIINKERGKEVHLANYPPSDLANESYFGQAIDDTRPNIGKYYKTSENLPWAINFPNRFEYPLESSGIDKGHKKFIRWVLSEGEEFKNWYKDEDEFRDKNHLYKEKK
jgi:LruC domain-containing protein